MSLRIPNDLRDSAITAFRQRICDQMEVVPLVHQAQWWAAADGRQLLEVEVESDDHNAVVVQLDDKRTVSYATLPRVDGRAKVIADLGAFKVGKSFGSGLWAASFGCIPHGRVSLIGIEYDICAPEFEYICEALLSERGLGLKYDSLQNRPRDGKMWLDLPNGMRFEAKSWERKDTLKGKEIDAYLYCEAYMLPGLECYTSVSQNLRAREGYAVFPTTPDRPWLKEIHDCAHSGDPRFRKWHCTCGVASNVNAWTFSQEDMERDKSLMTSEKYQIHYLGQLGDFVGRVYGYQRGQKVFTPQSHQSLFREEGFGPVFDDGTAAFHPVRPTGISLEDIRVPGGWVVMAGADTGTFSSAVIVAFSPDGDAFVLWEGPNYKYVAGVPELDESLSIPQWTGQVVETIISLGGRPHAWADRNSQFKREVQNYGLTLLGAAAGVEQRTEISREYFQQGKIYLAPWLSVLPFELENAQWPEEATAAGKFARVKDRDHTLDCLEHILAKRPRGKVRTMVNKSGTYAESVGWKKKKPTQNVHLGRN